MQSVELILGANDGRLHLGSESANVDGDDDDHINNNNKKTNNAISLVANFNLWVDCAPQCCDVNTAVIRTPLEPSVPKSAPCPQTLSEATIRQQRAPFMLRSSSPPHNLIGVMITIIVACLVSSASMVLAIDPSLPLNNTATGSATFTSTSEFAFEGLTLQSGEVFTIQISGEITTDVHISCVDCVIQANALWIIVVNGFYAPNTIEVDFTNLLVDNGGLMFSGTFPENTVIGIEQSTFLSDGQLVWPAATVISAQDNSPTLLFESPTFLAGSVVAIHNNMFAGRYSSGPLTMIAFSGNMLIDDAHIQVSGAMISVSAANGNCMTVCMGDGTSLQLTNSAIFELQGISFTHPSARPLRFGNVDVASRSTVALEALTLYGLGNGVEFIGSVTLQDTSAVFLRHISCMGIFSPPAVLFSNTLTLSNGSTVAASELRILGSSTAIAFNFPPTVDVNSAASYIVGTCLFAGTTEQLFQVEFTNVTSCDGTCEVPFVCSSAGSTLYVTPYVASSQTLACMCACDPSSSDGQRCFPRVNQPKRVTSHFTFAPSASIELSDTKIVTGAAFSGVTLEFVTLSIGSVLQVELCKFGLFSESFSTAATINTDSLTLESNSLISISGCSASDTREDAALGVLQSSAIFLSRTETLNAAIVLSDNFPFGSVVQVSQTSANVSTGASVICGSNSGYYGVLFLCSLLLQSNGALIVNDMLVTEGGSSSALIVIGGKGGGNGLELSTSQFLVELIDCEYFTVGNVVKAVAPVYVHVSSLFMFTELSLATTLPYFDFTSTNVIVEDHSVFAFDKITSQVVSNTLFVFAKLAVTSQSWFLLRSISMGTISTLIQLYTSLDMQGNSQLTMSSITTDSSFLQAYLPVGSVDATQMLTTKCLTASSLAVNMNIIGLQANAIQNCGICSVVASCYYAYTSYVAGMCECTCANNGHGALCLPLLPASGLTGQPDPSFATPAPPPSTFVPFPTIPTFAPVPTPAPITLPPMPTPGPDYPEYGGGQLMNLTSNLTIYNATVEGSLFLVLDNYIPANDYIEVHLIGWAVLNGAQLYVNGSIDGKWNGSLASGGLLHLIIEQFYFDSSVVVVSGNLPQGMSLEFRDCIFTTRRQLNILPTFDRFLGPQDHNPFVLFYEITVTNGTSIAFFNTIMINANRSVPTTLISFAGTTVFFGSSFVFEGFTVTGSSDFSNSNIMTVSYMSANQSASVVKRKVNFPTNSSGLRCRPYTLLVLVGGSVFRISDGQVPALSGSGFIFGCVAVYDHSALVLERIRAVVLPTPLIRFEQGLYVEDHSWGSIRNVVSAGPIVAIEARTPGSGVAVDATSSVSFSSMQSSSGTLLTAGVETAINWTVADTARTRSALHVQCNRINGTVEVTQAQTFALLYSFAAVTNYRLCSLASPNAPMLVSLGVAYSGPTCSGADSTSSDCNAGLFCSSTDPSTSLRATVGSSPSATGLPAYAAIACTCATAGTFNTTLDSNPLSFYGPQCLPTTRGSRGTTPLSRHSPVFTFRTPYSPTIPNFPFATFGPPAFMGLDMEDVVVQGVLLQFEVCSSPRFVFDPNVVPLSPQSSAFTLNLGGTNLQSQGRLQVVSCSNGSLAAPAPYGYESLWTSGAAPLILPLMVDMYDHVVQDGNIILDGDLPPGSHVVFRDMLFTTAQSSITAGMCGDSMEPVPGFLILCRVRVQHGSVLAVQNILFEAWSVVPKNNPVSNAVYNVFGSASNGGVSAVIAIANGMVVMNGSQVIIDSVYPVIALSDKMQAASVLAVVCTPSVSLNGQWNPPATTVGLIVSDRSVVILSSIATRMNRTTSMASRTDTVHAPIMVNGTVLVQGVSTLIVVDLDDSRRVSTEGNTFNSNVSALAPLVNQSTVAIRGRLTVADGSWVHMRRVMWHSDIALLLAAGGATVTNSSRMSIVDSEESADYFPYTSSYVSEMFIVIKDPNGMLNSSSSALLFKCNRDVSSDIIVPRVFATPTSMTAVELPATVLDCNQCTLQSTCVMPLTSSVNPYQCTCNCIASTTSPATGLYCFPIAVYNDYDTTLLGSDGKSVTPSEANIPFVIEEEVLNTSFVFPATDVIQVVNTTLINRVVARLNIPDLYPLPVPLKSSDRITVEIIDCDVEAGLIDIVGWMGAPYPWSAYSEKSFLNDAAPGAQVNETDETSGPMLYINITNMRIRVGSALMIRGRMPPRTFLTIDHIVSIDDPTKYAASSMNAFYPVYLETPIPPLHLYQLTLKQSDALLKNLYLTVGAAANKMAAIMMENTLYMFNSTLVFKDSVFVSTATEAPIKNVWGMNYNELGGVLGFINLTFQTSLATASIMFQYGIQNRNYGVLLVQNIKCEKCFMLGTLYTDASSQVVFDGITASGPGSYLYYGTITVYANSRLLLSNILVETYFSGGSFYVNMGTIRARCLRAYVTSTNGNTTNISTKTLTNASMVSSYGIYYPWTDAANPVLGCGQTAASCDASIECYGPLTEYGYAGGSSGSASGSTCFCSCFRNSSWLRKDDRFCFVRSIPGYRGTTLYDSLGYFNSTPPSPSIEGGSRCGQAATMPAVTADGGQVSFPYSWTWTVNLDRPVGSIEGVVFNGQLCSRLQRGTIVTSNTVYSLPSWLLVGLWGMRYDIMSCGNAVRDMMAKYINVDTMRISRYSQYDYLLFTTEVFGAYGLISSVKQYIYIAYNPEVTQSTWLFFPPEISSVSGCLQDVFPSTFRCAVDGTTPLTIKGKYFPSTITNVTLEFYASFDDVPTTIIVSSPANVHAREFDAQAEQSATFVPAGPQPISVAVCRQWQVVSNTTIVCKNISGRGEFAIVAITTPLYNTVRSKKVTVSFVPDLSELCPTDVNGVRCGTQGTCNPNTGTCTCRSSVDVGYWDGPACDECNILFNGSEASQCLQRCPVDDSGNICGGSGYCVSGLCICGEFTTDGICNDYCPGANGVCSNHGVCNTAEGTCACYHDAVNGFFTGEDCSECDPEFSGDSCTIPCPLSNGTGLPCNGDGTCFAGVCYCIPTACGVDCSVNKTNNPGDCESCPYPSQYGFNCAFTCPGSTNPMDVCSGHGVCDHGPQGSGSCLCYEGYGGPACSSACPADSAGTMCSGHGSCDKSTATCLCNRSYGGSACGSVCPTVNNVLCGAYGVCDEGSGNTGKCICSAGYFGSACNISCFAQHPPCSGHGVCQSSGKCQCYTSLSTGYWGGTDACSSCSNGWVGSSCNLQCSLGPNGLPCSGRGFCNNLLRCQCAASPETGYWADDVCGTCAYGYSGANCSSPCAGGTCSPCNLNGICNPADGSCACFNDTTKGFWNASTACNSCTSQYFGDRCQGKCINCGRGTCLDGQYGNGTCSCEVGFAVNGSGVCAACAPGYYGSQCRQCPTCNGQGSCLDGIARNGSCVCNAGYAGANCTFYCNISSVDGRLCGNGTCTANRTCTCRTNFTLDASLTCSACKSGLYGDYCNMTCPPCARGSCRRNGTCACPSGYYGVLCQNICPGGVQTPCSLHGQCHPLSGLCTCDSNTTLGFYSGTTCNTCQAAYASTLCNTACPFTRDGGVCSARGTCFNGACSSCTPRRNETSTVFMVCGAACNLTNEACLNFGVSCPLGKFGSECAQTCPGTTPGTEGLNLATCSSHGICSPDNGTCFCFSGYFGAACNQSCPFGFDVTTNTTSACTGRGVCSSTGACQCVRGYFGNACQQECPGGADHPCSDRGICSTITGTCTCSYGALGPACASTCPGGFDLPCNGRGVCDADSGMCLCRSSLELGFWTGTNCTQCAASYGGAGCNIPCPGDRGAVINGVCVCLTSFVGDDCSLKCPTPSVGDIGAGLVCGGHGSCAATFNKTLNATIASCVCDANFFGQMCQVFCTSSYCKSSTSYFRPQCSPTTGACECESTPGIWVGATCSVCATTRWGTECNQQCFCNNNGVCLMTTGECQCYNDDTNGHWAGTYCDACKSGYVGGRCQTANIALASQGNDTALAGDVGNVSAFLGAPSWCSFLDLSAMNLWAAGDETTIKVVKIATGSLVATINVGGVAIECSQFDATRIAVVVLASDLVTESLVLVDLGAPFGVHAVSRHFGMLATGPELLRQVSKSGFTCSMYGNRTTRLLSVASCTLANTTVVTTSINPPIQPSWSSIILLDNSPNLADRWQLIFTSATEGTVWMWNLATNASTTADSKLIGDGTAVTGDGVDFTMCSTNAQDIDALYCSGTLPTVADPTLFDVVLVALRVTAHEIRSVTRLEIGLSSTTALTALTVDPTFGLALLAYNTPNSASTILTMRVISWDNSYGGVEEVTVVGVQTLPMFQVALSLTVEAAGRTLMIVALRFTSVSILRYNLFGVLRVTPTIVDSNGGALLYIYGAGFPVNTTVNTLCVTGGVASAATVLNESTLTCVVKAASATSGGMCDIEYVNVVLGNTSSDTKTVGVRRPVPAIVSTVTTDAGSVGFGPSSISVGLTITGFGFVDSAAATCRIVNVTTRAEITRYAATAVNSSVALCRQSIAPPSAEPTCLEYSHDGYYFGTVCAPYQIVGDFGGADIKLGAPSPTAPLVSAAGATLTIAAASVTKIPNFYVATEDRYGNPRGPFEDTTNLKIRCSTLFPTIAITDRVPEELTFTANTSLTLLVTDGIADFTKTFVFKPLVGAYKLYCFPTIDTTMYTVVNLTIIPGSPAASSIVPSASWFVGVTKRNVLLPNPQLVLLDTAGNTIKAATSTPATLQYLLIDPHTLQFQTQKYVSIARSDGVYVFESIPMQSLFGIDTPLTFFVDGVPQTVLSIKQEVCLTRTEYSLRGTMKCGGCPDSGICDGTALVRVRPGYWRPSIDSYTFYGCSPEDACPENAATGCAAGYEGTMCSQCADGYGWSVNHCAECANHHVNRVLMAILLIAFVAIVFYMSIGTMPLTSIFDTMYLAALQQKSPISVIVKLLVSHFQIVALIPFSSLDLPSWFKEFFLIARSGSSVNPNLSFISCEIGDGVVNRILLSIVLCPIMIGILGLLALLAAKWTAYRFTKSAFDTVYVEKGITDNHNTARVAEYVAQGDQEHLAEVHKSHLQFFGEGGVPGVDDEELLEVAPGSPVAAWDGGASKLYGSSNAMQKPAAALGKPLETSDTMHDPNQEGDVANNDTSRVTFGPGLIDFSMPRKQSLGGSYLDFSKPSEEALAAEEAERERQEATRTLQSKKDKINRAPKTFLVRWINMVALATIVILFILLPSIIEFSASLLQCTQLDYGNGDYRSVVTAEPAMSCSDSDYAATTRWVWFVIVCFGVGVPAVNVLLVKALTRWTCEGNQHIAQDIFFFATGGYNRKMWYWESISLARKAILVLGATLLTETRMQVLWCVWFLLLSVAMNITFRPWASSLLSNVELVSLSTLALTFGIAEILLMIDSSDNQGSRSAMVVAVIVANALAVGVFIVSGLWFLKSLSMELAEQGGNIFADVLDDKRVAIKKRRGDIRLYLSRLNGIHRRFCVLSELELFIDRVSSEAVEHARNTANFAAFTGADEDRHNTALRIMQGGVYKSQKYRQRKDATPHVVERYATKSNLERSSFISKLLTSSSSLRGQQGRTDSSTSGTDGIPPLLGTPPLNPLKHVHHDDPASAQFGTPQVSSLGGDPSMATNAAGGGGMEAFCGIVADILRRTNQPTSSSNMVSDLPNNGGEGSMAADIPGHRRGPLDALEFKHVAVAFDDLWEMWAYWTSIAESCNDDQDPRVTALVEERMLELFAIEETLLKAIALLCEKVRLEQEN